VTAISERRQLAYIASQAADARVNVEIEAEGMTLNIGPQHPATHGTLRLVVRLDGEQVVAADPVIGYMHRGKEKLAEVRTYPQINALVDRIDWLGSMSNEIPFVLAAERLMGIEAPARAQWIRTIFMELGRISNLVMFLGDTVSSWGRSPRSSTPSATASSCSTRSRRPPAAGSTPTSTASAG
jgi:NADH-quinone oxidoreductase subunit D